MPPKKKATPKKNASAEVRNISVHSIYVSLQEQNEITSNSLVSVWLSFSFKFLSLEVLGNVLRGSVHV